MVSAQRPAPSAQRPAPSPGSRLDSMTRHLRLPMPEIRYMTNSLTRRVFVAALCTLPLAACGKSEPGTPAAGTPAGAGRGLKIAMIAKASTNPVFLSARTGAEAAAKELSAKDNVPIEIVWLTPPGEDGQVQAQRIAQAVNEGATAILISCSDAGK